MTKVWDDNNNQDGIRPAEIKVQLYANGTPVGNETVLNEGNAWSHTFTDFTSSLREEQKLFIP